MKTFYPLAIFLGFLVCSSANAAEKDWLSGSYDYVIPEADKAEMQKEGLSIPRLVVTKTEKGWALESLGKKVMGEPIDKGFYEKSLPTYGSRHEFQCVAAEPDTIFCHVRPGTKLSGGAFTSKTGYYMIRSGTGAKELTRVPDEK